MDTAMSMLCEGALLYDSIAVNADTRQNSENAAPPQDDVLAARARAGDIEAFEELVGRYRNDVFGLAFHFVRNREEAWDIAQEVFIKAYRGIRGFRGDAGFKTWLLRITANQCKDTFKKRRLATVALHEATRGGDIASTAPGPRRALETKELAEAIAAAVAVLPAKHRLAFILREYEGLSYHEMARVMRCNLGTVMSRLHHARRKLQRNLTRMGLREDFGHE